jgi:hypothetical protein
VLLGATPSTARCPEPGPCRTTPARCPTRLLQGSGRLVSRAIYPGTFLRPDEAHLAVLPSSLEAPSRGPFGSPPVGLTTFLQSAPPVRLSASLWIVWRASATRTVVSVRLEFTQVKGRSRNPDLVPTKHTGVPRPRGGGPQLDGRRPQFVPKWPPGELRPPAGGARGRSSLRGRARRPGRTGPTQCDRPVSRLGPPGQASRPG